MRISEYGSSSRVIRLPPMSSRLSRARTMLELSGLRESSAIAMPSAAKRCSRTKRDALVGNSISPDAAPTSAGPPTCAGATTSRVPATRPICHPEPTALLIRRVTPGWSRARAGIAALLLGCRCSRRELSSHSLAHVGQRERTHEEDPVSASRQRRYDAETHPGCTLGAIAKRHGVRIG